MRWQDTDHKADIFCVNDLNQCFDLKSQIHYDCLVFRRGVQQN